jgi:outer membrane protein OmpA-like peptidoglycan-associated protein
MIRTTTLLLAACLAVVCSLDAIAQTEMLPNRQTITPRDYPVAVSNLGAVINSSSEDFAPVVLGNGRILYYTSDRDGKQDPYTAVAQAGTWGQAMKMGEGITTDENDGGCTMTPDGHWMVFAGCDRPDGMGDCDLYIAEYVGGQWRNIVPLPMLNSRFWDSQPAISADGLTLVFASDRPSGAITPESEPAKNVDLWMSRRSIDGAWSAPVNMGTVINTEGDEISPFIAADNKTLYFASNGHPGVGGFDLYVSRLGGGSWSRPESIGTPINSAYDECFLTTQLGTDNIYFASTRPGGEGDLDIWLGVPNPLPPSAVTMVIGAVRDSKTKAPVGATLTVRDISTNEIVSTFHSDDQDGNYVVILQPGRGYVITSEAAGYLFFSERFDVPAESGNTTVRKDIDMTRDIVRLLVFFDFDKATLQKESSVDLDRAVQWLKANPSVKVELAGHTDNVGSREYNLRLSDERAHAVMNYLVSRGVSSSRLSAAGYGMDEPIATNETEEGRGQNRRVEFRVKQ